MKKFSNLLVLSCVLTTVTGFSLIVRKAESSISLSQVANEEEEEILDNYLGGPMTIAVSRVPMTSFGEGDSWCLSINSEGKAALRTDALRPYSLLTWDMDPKALLKLRGELKKQGFFSLKKEYGLEGLHKLDHNVAITIGRNSHAVTTFYGAESRETSPRFEAIFKIIQGWVDSQVKQGKQ